MIRKIITKKFNKICEEVSDQIDYNKNMDDYNSGKIDKETFLTRMKGYSSYTTDELEQMVKTQRPEDLHKNFTQKDFDVEEYDCTIEDVYEQYKHFYDVLKDMEIGLRVSDDFIEIGKIVFQELKDYGHIREIDIRSKEDGGIGIEDLPTDEYHDEYNGNHSPAQLIDVYYEFETLIWALQTNPITHFQSIHETAYKEAKRNLDKNKFRRFIDHGMMLFNRLKNNQGHF